MIEEIFKDIEGYEGIYQVSNYGTIKSLGNNKTRKNKKLKLYKNIFGYLCVSLSKEGKNKVCKVHRLVAQAFIDNPNNYKQVNHIDEDKTNNHVSNLEWCTAKYNINYGTRNKRVCEKNKISQKNDINKSKQVMCVETGKIYHSTMEVERELGFSNGNISSACTGRLNTIYGFHWRYI